MTFFSVLQNLIQSKSNVSSEVLREKFGIRLLS